MKPTKAQRAMLAALVTKSGPVKIGMHTEWRESVCERLAAAGLVTLDHRAHEEHRNGSRVASWVSDGTWMSITDAGRAVVAGAP